MSRTEFLAERGKRPGREHSLIWVFDAFEYDPGYVRARLFGCHTAYLDGRLCLAVADRGEPWNGLLVCSSHAHHAALMSEMPALRPHAILGKWLYVSQDDPDFEGVVEQALALVLARDVRIGVEAKGGARR